MHNHNHGGDKKTPSKIDGRHRKPDYSAKLRNWDKPKIDRLKEFIESDPANAVALVPISVGRDVNYDNYRFLAMLKLLKEIGFKSIVVLVADVLQRYYRLIESLPIILKDVLDNFKDVPNPLEEQIDNALYADVKKQLNILSSLTRKEGYQWILSNINSLEEVFGRGHYKMLRWDLGSIKTVENPKNASNDVQSFPEAFSFVNQLKRYKQLCVDKPECAKAVDESTQQFLSRIEQREAKTETEAESTFSRLLNKYRKQYSDEYIQEETAVMLALHDNDPRLLPVAYPGGANPALIQAVTDCIELEPGKIYPFILGEVGKTPAGIGFDVRIRENLIHVDEVESEETNKSRSSQPGLPENPLKTISIPPVVKNEPATPAVVTNSGLLHASFFGSNSEGSVLQRVTQLIAQQNAVMAQQNELFQQALAYDQQISISPPH